MLDVCSQSPGKMYPYPGVAEHRVACAYQRRKQMKKHENNEKLDPTKRKRCTQRRMHTLIVAACTHNLNGNDTTTAATTPGTTNNAPHSDNNAPHSNAATSMTLHKRESRRTSELWNERVNSGTNELWNERRHEIRNERTELWNERTSELWNFVTLGRANELRNEL